MNQFHKFIYSIIIIIIYVQTIRAGGIIKRAPKHVEIVKNVYLLKFSITPSFNDDNKKRVEIIKQHEYFHEEITKIGLNITVRYEFHELINAISFEAKEEDLESIVEIAGVKSIEPVVSIRDEISKLNYLEIELF